VPHVIQLTRLNRQPITVNPDWIGSVEPTPDTTLHLITGESLVVREGVDDVVARVLAWRARVLSAAGLSGLADSDTARVGALLDALRRTAAQRDPDHDFALFHP
jgi:flagellar protein FlbD